MLCTASFGEGSQERLNSESCLASNGKRNESMMLVSLSRTSPSVGKCDGLLHLVISGGKVHGVVL